MRSYFVGTLFALMVAPAFAGKNICWFDHVSSDGERMVLHFSSNANLQLWANGKSFSVRNGVITELTGKIEETRPVAEVSLAPGEQASGSAMPEDSCTYLASEKNGKQGLLVTASNNAFGLHRTATAFLLPE